MEKCVGRFRCHDNEPVEKVAGSEEEFIQELVAAEGTEEESNDVPARSLVDAIRDIRARRRSRDNGHVELRPESEYAGMSPMRRAIAIARGNRKAAQ